MTRTQTPSTGWAVWSGLLLAVVALALLGWILSSLSSLHDKLTDISPTFASIVLIAMLVMIGVILLLGVRFLWVGLRPSHRKRATAPAKPEDAAQESLAAARRQIELVSDEIARTALVDQLDAISSDLTDQCYTVVVFGTGSAGKTSVVNALLGNRAGATSPVVGTTRDGEIHEYAVGGFEDGPLRLVDTPGLAEFGEGGLVREELARELAGAGDLLIFVVDQDLRDFEIAPLRSLASLGKRVIMAVNKRDLYGDQDMTDIVAALNKRLGDVVSEGDMVICAADPAPVNVRDSASGRMLEPEMRDPDVADLSERMADILRADGRRLLANTILVRANRVARQARESIDSARREHARKIITRFQWTSAGVLFVNPVPGLGALAAAAINYQMITEIAGVFGITVSAADARRLARELAQIMLKMGLVSITTDLLGKALKASLVGYAAGGAIEAVAGAYLTRLSGAAFVEYFAEDQDWGEGGMQGAIERQFSLQRKDEFLAEFIKEATLRVLGGERKKGDVK
ncbi:MAG: YcjF family protein [Planctomycetota bacterium]|jgi:uncharacterized protein (DUF697 family)/signal recognition particle receptor subunit beta